MTNPDATTCQPAGFGTPNGIQPAAPGAGPGSLGRASTDLSAVPLLMSVKQLQHELGGVSERQISVLRARGWLPAPVELGPRLLRWRRHEVEAAIAAMPTKQEKSEPAQLLRARIERQKQTGVPA